MADIEPQDTISRIHRFFGLKPSAEQQRKLADAHQDLLLAQNNLFC